MCQLVYAFPRKCAKLLSPSTFSPPLQYLFSYSSKRKSYHDFNERIRSPFRYFSSISRSLFSFSDERFNSRSRETIFPSIPRNFWKEKMAKELFFANPVFTNHLDTLDKRREDERLSVIPFFFFFFFFGGRELPRATKSGPTLSGRHAKIEGRGTKGDIEDAFIWYCEDVRAHKKTGARPSAASPLSLGRPRPWKRTRLGSKVAAAAGCRFLNPANETC